MIANSSPMSVIRPRRSTRRNSPPGILTIGRSIYLIIKAVFDFRDLFNVIYGSKIVQDFKEGKLDGEGNALEPSSVEQLSSEEVCIRIAHQTRGFNHLRLS